MFASFCQDKLPCGKSMDILPSLVIIDFMHSHQTCKQPIHNKSLHALLLSAFPSWSVQTMQSVKQLPSMLENATVCVKSPLHVDIFSPQDSFLNKSWL